MLVFYTLIGCLVIGSQYIQPLSEDCCEVIVRAKWNNQSYSRSNCSLINFGNNEEISHETDENYEPYPYPSRFHHNAGVIFHLVQSICYLGWVTVAKIMLNPFGEDPENFDTGYMVNRNLKTSLQIVDGNPEVHVL